MEKKKDEEKVVATNRKAHHDYFIFDRYEAGVVLAGTEVKSIRDGRVNLRDAFCRELGGELFLMNCHVSPYEQANRYNVEPLRDRKLLLHKREIVKIAGKVAEKGLTIVPLRAYLKGGRVKLEIGLAKGKKNWDKRETIKRREQDREMRRKLSSG
ncbi:MAG: SsrA-binding protein SmpB [Acidobacteria bacterium]|nr:SsrA-binding protein SmpB [Acidobacteriota bacterium]